MAVRESERADPSVPVVRRACRRIIRPSVPERTVITRIDRHLAVASEVGVAMLDPTAVDQRYLAKRQRAQWIVRPPARVADRRKHSGARNAEAYRDVLLPIHGDTPKPLIIGITRIRPLRQMFRHSRLQVEQQEIVSRKHRLRRGLSVTQEGMCRRDPRLPSLVRQTLVSQRH
jgi:hypothetical protein